MKEATTLIARTVEVDCPDCGKRLDGFHGDPRGMEVDCEYCNNKFKIHPGADIEMEG